MTNLCYAGAWYLNLDEMVGREKRSAHPNLVPSQLYKTQDGWIFLMCNKEKFWPVLCNCIGHPEWSNDARFATFSDRLSNRDLITELLDEVLSTKTTTNWMTIFAGAVPAAPVNDVAQALQSEFLQATGQIIQYETSTGHNIKSIGAGVRQPNLCPRSEPAPALAADQTIIFGELGYTPEEAEALARGIG